jgi:hypothetical protein
MANHYQYSSAEDLIAKVLIAEGVAPAQAQTIAAANSVACAAKAKTVVLAHRRKPPALMLKAIIADLEAWARTLVP